MRYLIFPLIAIVLLLAIACNTESKKSSTEVSLLGDITEAQTARPEANDVLALFDLPSGKWNGAEFRFKYITDVRYTEQTKITLKEGESRLLSNSYARDKEVALFEDSISGFFDSLRFDTTGKPFSSVYAPIAEEANRLSGSTASRRLLIVYSDLMENTPELSFYDKKAQEGLKNTPEAISEALLQKVPLNRLDGIEIVFVYQPNNAADDRLFQTTAGLFKKLFTEAGATVSIVANLTAAPVAKN